MANLLLLYDLKERDLVRDFKDLFEELNIGSITMIPLLPDHGLTLEKKERNHFNSADGALFIITPGSERLGSLFPSPSVTHEMGQAKQKFQKKPENVIYLVDKNCNLPAIDQKAYIAFDREDIRSIISALIQLIKNLKAASIFRTTPIPIQVKPPLKKFDLEEFSKKLGKQIRQVLFDMSNMPNGYIRNNDLTALLTKKYHLEIQEINFIKIDLRSFGVANLIPSMTFWSLSDLGWSVVRLEIEKKKKAERESINVIREAFTPQSLRKFREKR